MDDVQKKRLSFVKIILWSLGLLIAIVVLILIVLMFVAIIFPPYKKDNDLSPALSLAAGSSQFIQEFARLTGSTVYTGDQVIPIDGANNFLPLLLKAINDASSSIDFTVYPWGNGTFSDQVFTALIAAAKRGVAVRVLLDAQGSDEIPASTIAALEHVGGKVAKYHQFSWTNPLQFNERDHMRTFVIDGTTGFFGGMAIDDHWLGADGEAPWEDMMFQVKGAMSASLQENFADMWEYTTGETIGGPIFYPPIASSSIVRSGASMFVPITSIPPQDIDSVGDAFDLSAMSAQQTLFIVDPYFVPDRQFLNIIEAKARSGVDVRIVVPGIDISNVIFLRIAWHRYYEEMLAAGIKIYEYQPSMIHTKAVIADSIWSLVGSANLDNRSEEINAENMMGINNAPLALSLEETFTHYEGSSTEITLDQWHKEYGFFSRLASDFLLIFRKQY